MYEYKPPEYYFEESSHQTYFQDTRHATACLNGQNRGCMQNIKNVDGKWQYGAAWTETDELKLVDKLWRTWFGESYSAPQQYPALDLDKLETKALRKNELRPFRIAYQSYNEIKLRLSSTLISIKGHPFIVSKVTPITGGFGLLVSDGSKYHFVKYDDLTDLRSIPPKYISGNSTGWLCRTPGRVYQQGINRNNTMIKTITGEEVLASVDLTRLCTGIRKEQDRKWSESYASLLQGKELDNLRLTDDIAVTYDGEDILACYRGRKLGTVQDDDILVMDEDDLLQGWIGTAAKKAGFNLSA